VANQEIGSIIPQHQQLIWINKNTQKKVFANTKRASNGALIVQQTAIVAGIPVTVGTLDGWMTRLDFEALQAHNESTLTPFTLKINDDTMQVIWDNTGDAITGDDLYPIVGGSDTLTNVILKFLTV
jgi:hypothetical protein